MASYRIPTVLDENNHMFYGSCKTMSDVKGGLGFMMGNFINSYKLMFNFVIEGF